MGSNLKKCNLNGVSVVILAQSHNPSIVNPDFLAVNDMVPDCGNLQDGPISTPLFAEVRYENVKWQVESNRCLISEDIGDGKFSDSYRSPICARRYAEVLEHIHYTAIGLNWHLMGTLVSNSNDWMISKFLSKTELRNRLNSVQLTFDLFENDVHCLLALQVADEHSLAVDANFHFALDDVENRIPRIRSILDDWRLFQEKLIGYLENYIFEEKLS